MGILDNKNRILDVVITDEGRKQLSIGQFNIKFVAFSDKSTFYKGDILSGSADASERIYFEAISLPQDTITFESDDSGKLMNFESEGNLKISKGKILSGTTSTNLAVVTSSIFSSLSETIISSSIDNFDKLKIIGSKDLIRDELDENKFNLNKNSISFEITNRSPLSENSIKEISIDHIESFFQDKRLSHIPNFKFLPPINKPTIQNPSGSSLGKFIPIGQNDFSDSTNDDNKFNPNKQFEILLNQLKDKPFETIKFTQTSRYNNIFSQFFEVKDKDMLKLDIIDFGSFPSDNPNLPDPHVFFVGKVYKDSFERHTFVNIFTLIFR